MTDTEKPNVIIEALGTDDYSAPLPIREINFLSDLGI